MATVILTWLFLAQVSKEYKMRKVIVGLCLIALIYGFLNMWQTSPDKVASASSLLNNTLTRIEQSVQHSSVEGKPTISAGFIDKVLSAAGSKAAGTGQALYDDGVKYGIDPVYALAFFEHESTFGTGGVARATLSLGNIRCSDGYACIEGYRAYGSYEQGYEDWYRLIKNLYIDQWHLTTVEQIVPKYAPSSDGNDVSGYIAAVEKDVSTWRAGQA
jgi:hypothetical protein